MEFGPDYQRKIVAILLRSAVHASIVASLLDPQWIENDTLADIAEVAAKHVAIYKLPPTRFVLAQECGEEVVRSPIFRKVMAEDISDAEYAMRGFAEFCRTKAVSQAIFDSAKDVESGKLDGVVDRMRKAVSVGMDTADLGSLLSDIKNRRKWYLNRERVERIVPTGWEPLDYYLKGGLGAGELGVVMAGLKVGKSWTLANFAVNTTLRTNTRDEAAGTFAVYYTLEISKKKTLQRIDKIITGRQSSLLSHAPRRFVKAFTKRYQMFHHPRSDILVQQFPGQFLKPSMMRAHLDAVEREYKRPVDAIFIDYLNEMKAERQDERRFELSSLASDVRGIAVERMVPIWTATQTNRGALNKKVVTAADVAEDLGMLRVADAVIALCQTEEEKAEGKMRAFLAAMRDAQSLATIDLAFDFDIGYIRALGRRDPGQIVKSDSDEKINSTVERAFSKRRPK